MTRPYRRVVIAHNEGSKSPWRKRAGYFLPPFTTNFTDDSFLHNITSRQLQVADSFAAELLLNKSEDLVRLLSTTNRLS